MEAVALDIPLSSGDIKHCAHRRIAIVGVGGVGGYAHIPSYERLGVHIAALADEDVAALERAGSRITSSVGPQVFSNLETFLKCVPALDLDVIDLALPSPLHDWAISCCLDALGDRCPALLVQKPLVQSLDRAVSIVQRAKSLGVRIFVNMNGRFVPTFSKMKDLVSSSSVGDILYATVLNRGLNRKSPAEWRAQIDRLILYEMAVHHIDFLMWSLGPPRSVFAQTKKVPGLGVLGEGFASIIITFQNDAIATLVEDWACETRGFWHYHPTGEEISLTGTSGTISATPVELHLSANGEDRKWVTSSSWFPDAFAGPMCETLVSLAANRGSMLDAVNHLPVLEVLEAAYQSNKTNSVVHLKE